MERVKCRIIELFAAPVMDPSRQLAVNSGTVCVKRAEMTYQGSDSMISKWQWFLAQIGRMLWVRATLFTLLGVGAALLSTAAEQFWPHDEAALDIGADAVGTILDILASSMLAVTTFSLTVRSPPTAPPHPISLRVPRAC
jgi:uncharacterized membrane protein